VVPNSKVNSELAAAREIQLKYVQQLAKEERAARRQQNLAKRTERLARASVKQGPVQTKGRLQSRTRQSIMVILTILVLAVFLILSLLILMCIKQKENVIPLSSY
jgi:hypothetical protein